MNLPVSFQTRLLSGEHPYNLVKPTDMKFRGIRARLVEAATTGDTGATHLEALICCGLFIVVLVHSDTSRRGSRRR
jgi:hypothetical protein